MQVTIDSNEPLERVLRVVGALYDVELSVGAGAHAAASRSAAAPTAKRATKSSNGRPRRPRGRRNAVDTAVVRQWAREHGHEVSDRGRIPNAVIEAYQESVAS
jgi:hypothetical protein